MMVIKELNANFPNDYVLTGGDFNLTLDKWMDRWPTKFLQEHNPIIGEFVNYYNLIDLWRNLNRDTRQFTWFKPNGSAKLRIDYWLVSNSILKQVTQTNI